MKKDIQKTKAIFRYWEKDVISLFPNKKQHSKKDFRKTKVIFKYWENDVIAIFPELSGNMDLFTCQSYQHIGQHSTCDPRMIIKESRPATSQEYNDLKVELENLIGYNLEIIKRYRESYFSEIRRKEYN